MRQFARGAPAWPCQAPLFFNHTNLLPHPVLPPVWLKGGLAGLFDFFFHGRQRHGQKDRFFAVSFFLGGGGG